MFKSFSNVKARCMLHHKDNVQEENDINNIWEKLLCSIKAIAQSFKFMKIKIVTK